MKRNREITISVYVAVQDVQQAIGCSRSAAYDHLRRAAGRVKGERGMLRVPVHRWERYAKETFSGQMTNERRIEARTHQSHGRNSRSTPEEIAQVIPITQPRTKPRKINSDAKSPCQN